MKGRGFFMVCRFGLFQYIIFMLRISSIWLPKPHPQLNIWTISLFSQYWIPSMGHTCTCTCMTYRKCLLWSMHVHVHHGWCSLLLLILYFCVQFWSLLYIPSSAPSVVLFATLYRITKNTVFMFLELSMVCINVASEVKIVIVFLHVASVLLE